MAAELFLKLSNTRNPANIDWEDNGFFGSNPDATRAISTEVRSDQPDWENPNLTGFNRLPPHAPIIPAITDGSVRPIHFTLDGRWKFHLSRSPEESPAGFWHEHFDDGAWANLMVPGHWELQGQGVPIYTNIQYPFPPNPPHVPKENPTGHYRTKFVLPEEWLSDDLQLTFEGVDSAFHVWLNGQPLGFSTGSRYPSAFRINELVRKGDNHLTVRVYRWSTGTYLEDQDMWWLSGIFRSVRIEVRSRLHIRDWVLHTHPQGADGGVQLDVSLHFSSGVGLGGRLVLVVKLEAPNEPTIEYIDSVTLTSGTSQEKMISLRVAAPKLWTAESPHLYRLSVTTLSGDGAVVENWKASLGIRYVTLQGGQLLINSVPIKLRGINRHEFHPATGRTVTVEDTRRDLCLIKQGNFNAVRTAHYPNIPEFYELCDEIGLYVVDEADLETHGLQDTLSQDPTWEAAYLERMERLVRRDRNYACIIAWSLGNESGFGRNIEAAAARVREIDPSRPINYYHAQTHPVVDWVGLHYTTLAQTRAAVAAEKVGLNRPVLLEEYAHAWGNAVGNLAEYWELIESEPSLLGGFIWSWCDLALHQTIADGRTVYAYGGDFGDQPNDGHWAITGITFPDRRLKGGYWEAKKILQPVALLLTDPICGRLEIRSKRDHAALEEIELTWTLSTKAQPILISGRCDVPRLEPAQIFTLSLSNWTLPQATCTHGTLTVEVRQKGSVSWADSGHEIAWEQFFVELPSGAVPPPVPASVAAPIAIHHDDAVTTLKAGELILVSNRHDDRPRRLLFRDQALLEAGPELILWRAPLDTDAPFKDAWKRLHPTRLTHKTIRHASEVRPDKIILTSDQEWSDAEGSHLAIESVVCDFNAEGLGMRLKVAPNPSLACVARMGWRFRVPVELCHVAWSGRGPHECLSDRSRGAKIGQYAATLEELIEPHIFPQEGGQRTDTRRLVISNQGGTGLMIDSDHPFTFSLRPWSMEAVASCLHHHELRREPTLELCLDYVQAGTGNTGLRAERLPQYQITPFPFTWNFSIFPLGGPFALPL